MSPGGVEPFVGGAGGSGGVTPPPLLGGGVEPFVGGVVPGG